jgi:hypothetical protein
VAHQHHTHRSLINLFLCFMLAAGWLAGPSAPAANAQNTALLLVVNTLIDSNEPEYQICANGTSGTPDCSLRGAISKANNSAENIVKIRLASDQKYLLTIQGAGEDYNATGDLDIRRAIYFEGNRSTIDASQVGDRVMEIHFIPVIGWVNFYQLKITGGHAPNGRASGTGAGENGMGGTGGSGSDGGGIKINANGRLSMIYSTITGNTASSGGNGGNGQAPPALLGGNGNPGGYGGSGDSGGGIYVAPEGQLTIEYSIVEKNAVGNGGNGGTGSDGKSSLRTTCDGGAGGRGGTGGNGGGIYSSNDSLNISYSTFEQNTAGASGAGGNGGNGGDVESTGVAGGTGGKGGDGGSPGSGGGIYAKKFPTCAER